MLEPQNYLIRRTNKTKADREIISKSAQCWEKAVYGLHFIGEIQKHRFISNVRPQTSLYPVGPVIKCFVVTFNSKIEKKTVSSLLGASWHNKFGAVLRCTT